ncbi:hypothetical protein M407DRAFT_24082 [Tulasnella calospora MUT 4182]|uniref:F-box domain-containing protein n=1 Tax=Tulasnella calospora MUT 4182 TaxID=1051891 RepID=A0A0C3LZ02_9AGAM|nr:hypothetical protein M407DRAFT_24082 [Tulasnella calospora MUT 4182]
MCLSPRPPVYWVSKFNDAHPKATLKPWEQTDSEEDWGTDETEDEIDPEEHHVTAPVIRSTQNVGSFTLLPVELVANILYLVCSPSTDSTMHAKLVYQLMSVCTLFNDVILGKPEFWNSIVMPLYDRPIDHIPLYVQRSKSLPLNIILHLRPHDHGFSRRQRFKARTFTLFGEAHRWRTLQIVMDDPWKDITSVLPPVLPTLESLQVTSKHRHALDRPPLCIRTRLPRLNSLQVEQVRLDWSALQLEQKLDTLLLHDLYLDTETWFACFGFVRACTQLRNLEFRAIVPPSGVFVPLQTTPEHEISLPLLQALRITTNAPKPTTRTLIRNLHAPELRALWIGQTHLLTLAVTSSKWDFEGAHLRFPRLERLILQSISGVEEVLRNSLSDLPTITHLAILQGAFTSPSTLPLNDDTGHLLCPNLTSLVTKGISPQVLRSALEPYALAGVRLRLWAHADDIALSGLSGESAFEELEQSVSWLRRTFDLRTVGMASTALYRSWEAVRSRLWMKHQVLGADATEVEGWSLRL